MGRRHDEGTYREVRADANRAISPTPTPTPAGARRWGPPRAAPVTAARPVDKDARGKAEVVIGAVAALGSLAIPVALFVFVTEDQFPGSPVG
jgi:hypothetical protein